jgi:hypothetical protein
MRCLRPFAKARLTAVVILCLSAQAATTARAGSSSTPVRSERQKLWAEEVKEAITRQSPQAAARTGSVSGAGAQPARGAAQNASGKSSSGPGPGEAGPGDKGQGRGGTGSDGSAGKD